jgi:hypothetical protein
VVSPEDTPKPARTFISAYSEAQRYDTGIAYGGDIGAHTGVLFTRKSSLVYSL